MKKGEWGYQQVSKPDLFVEFLHFTAGLFLVSL